MGLLTQWLDPRPRADVWKPWDDRWYENVNGVATTVGIPVTPTLALQVAAVFACVQVISETLASLPLIVYERVEGEGKRRAPDHPLYEKLHESPNAWQTSMEFIDDQQGHAALHGNCFAEILPGPSGAVEELVPLHPSRITVEQLANRRLRYTLREPNGGTRTLTQDQVFHVRSRSLDFITGLSRRESARDAIALARAIETYAARFFANDASIGLAVEYPKAMSDTAYKRLKESITGLYTGVRNAHKPFILEDGAKLARTQMTAAKDAQLTEAQEASVLPICRYFRMPPHKIQHLLHATFSNIEHQGIEFVTDTIVPWARRWETRINATLITDPRYFAEFNLAGLLRGDNAGRAAYYQSRFNIGTLSINDIRRLENENPLPAGIGDRYFVQGALIPVDRLDDHIDRQVRSATPPGAPRVEDDEEDVDVDEPTPTPPSPANAHELAATVGQVRPVRAFRLLLADAADRMARAESREIAKRLEKVGGDSSRITVWLAGFLDEHDAYVARTLQPLVSAWEHETDETPALGGLVAQLRAGSYAPGTDFAAWDAGRAATIAATLRAAFACDDAALPPIAA